MRRFDYRTGAFYINHRTCVDLDGDFFEFKSSVNREALTWIENFEF